MSHCHDDHDDHDHHGGGGSGGGEHDHSDDITPALQFSLYQHIHFDEIQTRNERIYASGKAIVKKTWAERLSDEPELASDADEQLLMDIPFTGQVKLHAILVRTSDSRSAPRTLKVIANRDDVDFATADEARATQTLELSRTGDVQELPVRRALFSAVRRLVLFFPDNFGNGDEDEDEDEREDRTRISYVGFRGEWMRLGRAPTNILYEAAANPSDHKLKGTAVHGLGHGVGGRGPGA